MVDLERKASQADVASSDEATMRPVGVAEYFSGEDGARADAEEKVRRGSWWRSEAGAIGME